MSQDETEKPDQTEKHTGIREIARGDWKKKTRRSFLTMGLSALGGFFGWKWLNSRELADGLPWPLREGHRFNEKVNRAVFDPDKVDTPLVAQSGRMPRLNGLLGLEYEVDLENWELVVETPGQVRRQFRVQDLSSFAHQSSTAEFRCIEGWSERIGYSGIAFREFLKKTGVGTRSGQPYTDSTPLTDLFPYVGLETPDAQYYVSIDIESMLHPQTILATELNGVPLDDDHGAPLRLVIPVKYGIKNLKRVGRLFFADQRPRDYWAERGYDWYSGL